MKNYIVYKFDPQSKSGRYNVLNIREAFSQMNLQGTDLPRLRIEGFEINQVEVELKLAHCELLRLVYKHEEWIITKIWSEY